ncbi:GSCOCG00006872001-RA-CDS [Cotesia congregata]|nr:GSCOCG00006872001-RA-CDS [Cotesia congregata]
MFSVLGWFCSGDLGYYDEDGDIFIVERIKELIKYRLHHVAPAAIENVIQELPGVAEVAVVAKPNLEDLEQPMAFVTRVPGMEVSFQ